ncbi:MAG TPA: hypothetical protein VGE50_11290 [Gammaproteobacteria bacterium]
MDNVTELESLRIAQKWLDRYSFSAATWNLDDHMRLISQDIQLHGMPSVGVIDYAGFRRRRHNEFSKKLLLSITHKGLELLESNGDQITFVIKETLKSTRGESFVLDKEVRLRCESDGAWRAVHELIKQISRK